MGKLPGKRNLSILAILTITAINSACGSNIPTTNSTTRICYKEGTSFIAHLDGDGRARFSEYVDGELIDFYLSSDEYRVTKKTSGRMGKIVLTKDLYCP